MNTSSERADSHERAGGPAVVHVERRVLRVPYRETPGRNLERGLPHWRYLEHVEVHLSSGHVGHGEAMLFYTWRRSTAELLRRATGGDAARLMRDDSLGAALQMALFDAVGCARGVPIHRLLGRRVRDRVPLAWWVIDLPPEDLAEECREASRRGYRCLKTKARPWQDLWRQMEAVTAAVPAGFEIQLDFNGTLLDADRARPILEELGRHPRMGRFEEPIPPSDLAGWAELGDVVSVPMAVHLDETAGVGHPADGFLVAGGVERLLAASESARTAGKPVELQLVGTGITAAFCLHLQAVLECDVWPAVTCHEIFEHPLLARPIPVTDGTAAVPDAPGLGLEIDREAIRRFEVPDPGKPPAPERLIEVRWPDGSRRHFTCGGVMRELARRGRFPFYSRGVTTRLVPDDGTDRWRSLYEDAVSQPRAASRWAGIR